MATVAERSSERISFWESLPLGMRKTMVSLAVLVGPAMLADVLFGRNAAGFILLTTFVLLSMQNGSDRVRGG